MTDLNDFFRQILDNLYDGVYFVDRRRRITYWNKGAERISGYDAKTVIGSRCMDAILMHVDEEGTLLCHTMCPLADTMLDGQVREVDVFLHHQDGHRVPVRVRTTPLRDEHGRIVGGVESFSDNSAVVAAINRVTELNELIHRDTLTGVGNRRQVESKLAASLFQQQELDFPTGLLFIDIDNFKQINDTSGHEVGDQVLRMVANTLAANIRTTDFLGRWGGDEFIGLITNISTEQLRRIADKLRALVARSNLYINQEEIKVTISIGATLSRPEDTPESLIERADTLMYKSKLRGRNRVSFNP